MHYDEGHKALEEKRGGREREREGKSGRESEVGQKHTSSSGKIHVPTWMMAREATE